MKWIKLLFDLPDAFREGASRGQKVSGVRICAMLCIVTGCVLALHKGDSVVIGELIAGGGVALWSRSEAES